MFFRKKHKKKKPCFASGFSSKREYGLTTYEFKKLCESIQPNDTVKIVKFKKKYSYAN